VAKAMILDLLEDQGAPKFGYGFSGGNGPKRGCCAGVSIFGGADRSAREPINQALDIFRFRWRD
jgi:hypothetical protein